MNIERTTGVVACLFVGLACGDSQPPAPAPSAVAAMASSAPSVASSTGPAPADAPFRVVAKVSGGGLLIAGSNGDGIVLGARTGLRIQGGKLSEQTSLYNGLERAWTEETLWAVDGEVLGLSGRRDPTQLMRGDVMLYGEDLGVVAESTVVRAFRGKAWMHAGAVAPGASVAIGRYQGRLVAAMEEPDNHDYSVRLLAGKVGFAPPKPGRLPKPEEAPEATEPAGAGGAAPEPAASASASTSAAPPPAPQAEPSAKAPADPNVPNPPEGSGCVSRIVPRAADGLAGGEFMVAGPVCEGSELWIEHWPKAGSASAYEKVPQPPGGTLALAMTTTGSAYLAAIGERWLLQRSGSTWKQVDVPGSGAIKQLAASPGGRAWLVVGGEVFSRRGDEAWQKLVLPAGKVATHVMPSDDVSTFVVAGDELIGPSATEPKETVEFLADATSICTEPYVVVKADVKRGKEYPDDVARAKAAGVAGIELVIGRRGILGKEALEAKVPDMAGAKKLAAALRGDLLCGAPKDPLKVE